MFTLIAGPCVIESYTHALKMANALTDITTELGIPFIFKSSFKKANRTSMDSYTGPSTQEAVRAFRDIETCRTTTDIHKPEDALQWSAHVDVLQIPALLSRQTRLIFEAAAYCNFVTIKKGQFSSPHDMKHAVAKAKAANEKCQVAIIERGTTFGYNNLVVDMRSLKIMREENPHCPIIFDGTHSVQLPGSQDGSSGGQREFVRTLCRAAIGAGVDGLFLEVHDDPDAALCDGPNMIPLNELEHLLFQLKELHTHVEQTFGFNTRPFGK